MFYTDKSKSRFSHDRFNSGTRIISEKEEREYRKGLIIALWIVLDFSYKFISACGKEGAVTIMSGRKLTPGMSFRIITQDAYQAVLEYTYYCPYCMRKSTSQSVVFPVDYERLESGGFYDTLTCSQCSKNADVRFWQTMKKTTKEKEP